LGCWNQVQEGYCQQLSFSRTSLMCLYWSLVACLSIFVLNYFLSKYLLSVWKLLRIYYWGCRCFSFLCCSWLFLLSCLLGLLQLLYSSQLLLLMFVVICEAIFVAPLFSVFVRLKSILLFLLLVPEVPFCLKHVLNLERPKFTVNFSLPVRIYANFSSVMNFLKPEPHDW
jgi:hypothetical protein